MHELVKRVMVEAQTNEKPPAMLEASQGRDSEERNSPMPPNSSTSEYSAINGDPPPKPRKTPETKRRLERRSATYEVDPETGGVLIPLAGKKRPGLCAIVDAEDLARVIEYSWSAVVTNPGCGDRRVFYAHGKVKGKDTYLHRFILGLTDRRIKVDHENHNGLDCRKSNMRKGTHQENIFNRRPNLNGTSSFKGVSWSKSNGKWCVQIRHDGKARRIGFFENEIEAAMAYDEAARKFFGERAYLNFPDRVEEEAA